MRLHYCRTAGRVLKHIEEANLKLEDINSFVLDEADKMLDMGFYDDISKIASMLPKNRQICFLVQLMKRILKIKKKKIF